MPIRNGPWLQQNLGPSEVVGLIQNPHAALHQHRADSGAAVGELQVDGAALQERPPASESTALKQNH